VPKTLPEFADRVLKLARLAGSSEAEEASSAALQACEIIREKGVVLFASFDDSSDDPALPRAPQKPGGPSTIHPAAAHYMEWRRFMQAHGLSERTAKSVGFCASCGEAFAVGDHVVEKAGVASTHKKCSGWWWNFEFPPNPDDDIPF
jgi:hypothetical protein